MEALLLLANSEVDRSQRISILEAAAPNSNTLDFTSSTDDYIASGSHEIISSVSLLTRLYQDLHQLNTFLLLSSTVRSVNKAQGIMRVKPGQSLALLSFSFKQPTETSSISVIWSWKNLLNGSLGATSRANRTFCDSITTQRLSLDFVQNAFIFS